MLRSRRVSPSPRFSMLVSSRLSLALGLALALSGCGLFGGGAAPAVPTAPGPQAPPAPVLRPVTLTIVGGAEMNAGGNAAVVKVYPLRGTSMLLGTIVESFWREGGSVGDDLAGAPQEVLVYPGESTTITVDLPADTPYLGLAADLRSPEPDAWRTTFEAPAVRGKTVTVTVGERALDSRVR